MPLPNTSFLRGADPPRAVFGPSELRRGKLGGRLKGGHGEFYWD